MTRTCAIAAASDGHLYDLALMGAWVEVPAGRVYRQQKVAIPGYGVRRVQNKYPMALGNVHLTLGEPEHESLRKDEGRRRIYKTPTGGVTRKVSVMLHETQPVLTWSEDDDG